MNKEQIVKVIKSLINDGDLVIQNGIQISQIAYVRIDEYERIVLFKSE